MFSPQGTLQPPTPWSLTDVGTVGGDPGAVQRQPVIELGRPVGVVHNRQRPDHLRTVRTRSPHGNRNHGNKHTHHTTQSVHSVTLAPQTLAHQKIPRLKILERHSASPAPPTSHTTSRLTHWHTLAKRMQPRGQVKWAGAQRAHSCRRFSHPPPPLLPRTSARTDPEHPPACPLARGLGSSAHTHTARRIQLVQYTAVHAVGSEYAREANSMVAVTNGQGPGYPPNPAATLAADSLEGCSGRATTASAAAPSVASLAPTSPPTAAPAPRPAPIPFSLSTLLMETKLKLESPG
jgi:hypothetical protein